MKSAARCILLLAVALLALSACKGVPDGVIDPERMARLLADIHIGEGVIESNPSAFTSDSAKRAFRQAIYARNGVTTEEVDSSLRWYGYNMDKYVEVYDRVIELLNADMAAVEQRAGSTASALRAGMPVAMEGDSVDVWYDARFRPFARSLSGNILPFVLRSEPNWERGDVYAFRSKMIGNSRQARFIVAVDYDDGGVETTSANMIGDGWHEVKFAVDSTRNVREIYGSLQYEAADGEVAFVDSISLVRTRWKPDKAVFRQGMQPLQRKGSSNRYD